MGSSGKMSGHGRLERRPVEARGEGAEQVRAPAAGATPGRPFMSAFVYLFRIGAAEQREAMGTPERAQQSMQRWLAWMSELEAHGHLKHRGQPLGQGGSVVRGKQKLVTDGPYAEKDLVAGYIVVEARDLAQAAELAAGCPMLEGGGAVEIRPVLALPQ
jgi:hypothetical protein